VSEHEARSAGKWWDFISYRRRYISDRTWFGAAIIAASLGSLGSAPGWWKLADLAGFALGSALTYSSVRHWHRRQQDFEKISCGPS
jgi:hypothetical protein